MANNCFYEMKVVGDKKKNIEEFISLLNYTHPDGKCFARIFSADPDPIEEKDGKYSVFITGDCAWSVSSCMTNNFMSYASEDKTGKLTNLAEATKKLMLMVEIFSEEIGMEFAEHFIYSNGVCLVNDVTNYSEIWYDPEEYDTVEDYIKAEGLDLTPEQIQDLKDGEYVGLGGFDKVFTI
jgi:hypothetical protein